MRAPRWFLMLAGLILLAACNPQIGYIYVNTVPPQAKVFINDKDIGETPVKFDFDMNTPVTLKIIKEGYQPRTEQVTVDWVKAEYHQGHYGKAEVVINGSTQKGFEVRTTRDLIRTE